MLVFILIGVVFLAFIGGIVYFVLKSRSSGIEDRLSHLTEDVVSLEELELQQSFYKRVIQPMSRSILNQLGKLGPKQSAEKAKLNLQAAGNPGGMTPTMFTGMRMGLAFALFVMMGGGVFVFTQDIAQAFLFATLGLTLGYLLPGMWLRGQIKKRKKNIQRSLPDCLDLLTISVEAGLGFDLALQRVADKWDNELSNEFKRVIQDMRLGRTRREAMRELSDRTGVDDVQTFVSAVIQAEQLGVSMSKILRLQSDQMRIKRRQRAEEQAQKAPVLMLIPMVFLIFPALFVVILGPAVPKIIMSLGGL
jgi:tight adherence protein C